jgi:predicted RNA-binding protein YlxR (DUF448 family)
MACEDLRKILGPIRTCLVCRARRPIDSLIRLAANKESQPPEVVFDYKKRLFGRGAWICLDNPDCLKRVAAKGRLARALRVIDPVLRLS